MFYALDIFCFWFLCWANTEERKNALKWFHIVVWLRRSHLSFQNKLLQFCLLFITGAHSMWICVASMVLTTTTTHTHLHIHMANSYIMYCFQARQFLAYSFGAIVGRMATNGTKLPYCPSGEIAISTVWNRLSLSIYLSCPLSLHSNRK